MNRRPIHGLQGGAASESLLHRTVSAFCPAAAARLREQVSEHLTTFENGVTGLKDGSSIACTQFCINFQVKWDELEQFLVSGVQLFLEGEVLPEGRETFARLCAFATSGNTNNCLCNAVSYALMGVQDQRRLDEERDEAFIDSDLARLRCAIRDTMVHPYLLPKFQRLVQAQMNPEFWCEDQFFDEVKEIATPFNWETKRWRATAEIHIFVLAHVVRRPIVVYSAQETYGEANLVGGIYLPHLWEPARLLSHTPLLVAFQPPGDSGGIGHYTALIPYVVEASEVPLRYKSGHPFPIRFPPADGKNYDPGTPAFEALLEEYLKGRTKKTGLGFSAVVYDPKDDATTNPALRGFRRRFTWAASSAVNDASVNNALSKSTSQKPQGRPSSSAIPLQHRPTTHTPHTSSPVRSRPPLHPSPLLQTHQPTDEGFQTATSQIAKTPKSRRRSSSLPLPYQRRVPTQQTTTSQTNDSPALPHSASSSIPDSSVPMKHASSTALRPTSQGSQPRGRSPSVPLRQRPAPHEPCTPEAPQRQPAKPFASVSLPPDDSAQTCRVDSDQIPTTNQMAQHSTKGTPETACVDCSIQHPHSPAFPGNLKVSDETAQPHPRPSLVPPQRQRRFSTQLTSTKQSNGCSVLPCGASSVPGKPGVSVPKKGNFVARKHVPSTVMAQVTESLQPHGQTPSVSLHQHSANHDPQAATPPDVQNLQYHRPSAAVQVQYPPAAHQTCSCKSDQTSTNQKSESPHLAHYQSSSPPGHVLYSDNSTHTSTSQVCPSPHPQPDSFSTDQNAQSSTYQGPPASTDRIAQACAGRNAPTPQRRLRSSSVPLQRQYTGRTLQTSPKRIADSWRLTSQSGPYGSHSSVDQIPLVSKSQTRNVSTSETLETFKSQTAEGSSLQTSTSSSAGTPQPCLRSHSDPRQQQGTLPTQQTSATSTPQSCGPLPSASSSPTKHPHQPIMLHLHHQSIDTIHQDSQSFVKPAPFPRSRAASLQDNVSPQNPTPQVSTTQTAESAHRPGPQSLSPLDHHLPTHNRPQYPTDWNAKSSRPRLRTSSVPLRHRSASNSTQFVTNRSVTGSHSPHTSLPPTHHMPESSHNGQGSEPRLLRSSSVPLLRAPSNHSDDTSTDQTPESSQLPRQRSSSLPGAVSTINPIPPATTNQKTQSSRPRPRSSSLPGFPRRHSASSITAQAGQNHHLPHSFPPDNTFSIPQIFTNWGETASQLLHRSSSDLLLPPQDRSAESSAKQTAETSHLARSRSLSLPTNAIHSNPGAHTVTPQTGQSREPMLQSPSLPPQYPPCTKPFFQTPEWNLKTTTPPAPWFSHAQSSSAPLQQQSAQHPPQTPTNWSSMPANPPPRTHVSDGTRARASQYSRVKRVYSLQDPDGSSTVPPSVSTVPKTSAQKTRPSSYKSAERTLYCLRCKAEDDIRAGKHRSHTAAIVGHKKHPPGRIDRPSVQDGSFASPVMA